MTNKTSDNSTSNEPILNVPSVIVGTLAVLLAIHIIRIFLLSRSADIELLIAFAFIPGRFTNPEIFVDQGLSLYWTPISYSFLHADWLHLIMNAFWMLAFGSAVAQRLGAFRFVVFSILASASGAALHIVMHWNELIPMIGASAVVSGCMGAACRFVFSSSRQFKIGSVDYPVQSIGKTFANRQAMTFILIWFLINYLFGSGIVDVTGTGGRIAWEAHVGGFLFGLFALPIFAGGESNRD